MFFNFNKIPQISPDDAFKDLNNKKILWLDVREVVEYQQSHIPGSTLFPMSLLTLKEKELEEFKDKEIIIYCHVGNRSSQVARWMDKKGYKVKNLVGGIASWTSAGFPINTGS